MCNIIVINKGEKEIGTPRQFSKHFGFDAPIEYYYKSMDIDSCLCQVDIERALSDNNIPFKKEFGDIYVGMLDDIVGDDD